MTVILHLLLFIGAFGGIWIGAGHIIHTIERVAHQVNKNSFAVAFFVLGLLTSLTEISVLINSTIEGVPHLSAGNLVGGSVVIYLFIIPLLAVLGRGIALRATMSPSTLLMALIVTALPVLVAMVGLIRPIVGLILIAAYALLLHLLAKQKSYKRIKRTVSLSHTGLLKEMVHLVLAGTGIFLVSKLLVHEGVYVAHLLGVPASIVGLLLLSIGTNAPELTIAVRAITSGRKAIAFGDYLGSAAANTLLFGILILLNGHFSLEPIEFMITAPLLILGLVLFYFFARSRAALSRPEGALIGLLYIAFLVAQGLSLSIMKLH